MSLIVRIEDELKAAMRAREKERTDTLRMTLASLRSAEKELQRPLKEDEELQVLQRERKRRTEAAEAFREGDRPGSGRQGGAGARSHRGVHAGADVRRRRRTDHR